MKTITRNLFTLILIGFISTSIIAQEKEKKNKKSPAEERAEIDKMTSKALAELYKVQPQARNEIANSKGYAVFGNFGMNLFLLSTANGAGKAVSGGKSTYMKMYSAGVGVGIGVKKFNGIFIFKTTKAYQNFIEEGWQGGGQADAAAKDNKQGGAVAGAISISPDIMFYQVTNKGLAAQATIQGTKYWKDKDLN
ncbi:lipid-binding SYLF domain-containing protein [Flavobacterium sp.]|uniref:lipid-binding SYLF domain-containing protein n=1 Tax=Flavobacterium sp. TaxID=239 RepID=UPI0040481298